MRDQFAGVHALDRDLDHRKPFADLQHTAHAVERHRIGSVRS